MTLSHSSTRLAYGSAALAVLGLLQACGGGGAATDSGTTPSTGSVVSEANGPALAGATYAALFPIFDLSNTRLDLLTTNDPTPRSEQATALSLVLQQLWALKGLSNAQWVARVSSPQVQSCTYFGAASGSITITSTDTNANGILDAGDSVRAQYSSCYHGNVPVQGSFTLRLNTLTQTNTQLDASVSVQFTSLVGAGAQTGDSVSGDLSLVASINSATPSITAQVQGSALAVNEGSKTSTLGSYTGSVAISTGAAYTTSVSGTIASSLYTGTYALTTPTAHTGVVGASATAGAWRLIGSTSGSMVMIALGTSGMRLTVDANRDGTLDSDQTLSWTQWAAL